MNSQRKSSLTFEPCSVLEALAMIFSSPRVIVWLLRNKPLNHSRVLPIQYQDYSLITDPDGFEFQLLNQSTTRMLRLGYTHDTSLTTEYARGLPFTILYSLYGGCTHCLGISCCRSLRYGRMSKDVSRLEAPTLENSFGKLLFRNRSAASLYTLSQEFLCPYQNSVY